MTDWKTRILEKVKEEEVENTDTLQQPDEINDSTRRLLFLEERQAIALEEISANLVKLIKALQSASDSKEVEEVEEEEEERTREHEKIEEEKEVEDEEEKKEESND